MLHSVAGSKIEIKSTDWLEIAEPEGLGNLGGSYELRETPDIIRGEMAYFKGAKTFPQMELSFGMVLSDRGQEALRHAYNLTLEDSYIDFRLTFPDGVTVREWTALVMSISETFDSANQAIRLIATLQLTTQITRSEATP